MSDILKDFDKKNEFPKVKIPKFDTGGICNDAMFSKNYFYSQIDEIAKDIRNRKDNAIAMEFTKCIGELLKKNGVTPKINECTANLETDKHFKVRYGVTIDELDFSEHDKVFEDEIAGLKAKIAIKDMDYKTASELLGKYQQENESLKQRIAELESKNESLNQSINEITTSRSEWIDKAVEWQQKCEKSESKEVEKPKKINLNDLIKVKLTPLGAEIYYHQYDEVNKKIKENGGTELEPIMPQIDKGGFTEIQLWHFMELYGKHIGMCKPNVIAPLDIIISE